MRFRAWDDYHKVMITDWLTQNEDFTFNGYDTTNNICVGVTAVMQFTGLKDKSGTDIYEGDVMSKVAYDGINEYTLITKVVFDNGAFCLEKISGSPKQEPGTLLSFPNDMPLIIGNIYQTPELL